MNKKDCINGLILQTKVDSEEEAIKLLNEKFLELAVEKQTPKTQVNVSIDDDSMMVHCRRFTVAQAEQFKQFLSRYLLEDEFHDEGMAFYIACGDKEDKELELESDPYWVIDLKAAVDKLLPALDFNMAAKVEVEAQAPESSPSFFGKLWLTLFPSEADYSDEESFEKDKGISKSF